MAVLAYVQNDRCIYSVLCSLICEQQNFGNEANIDQQGTSRDNRGHNHTMEHGEYAKNQEICANMERFQNVLLSERKTFRRKGKYATFLYKKEPKG